jgi:hypothetical protein
MNYNFKGKYWTTFCSKLTGPPWNLDRFGETFCLHLKCHWYVQSNDETYMRRENT